MNTHKRENIHKKRASYVLAGLLIGILVGFIVSWFRLLIGIVLERVVNMYEWLQQEPTYIPILVIVTIGLGIVLGKIVKSEPNIKGSGIPQVELQIQGKLSMNWWSVLWKKFVAGGIAIGSGLLLGREGPSIQLGSAIGQGFAWFKKSHRVQENIFISSGAGAGLAAAFNAPIAGLMFVLEEVHHTFSPLVALTTLTATVAANFVSLQIFGTKPALNIGNTVRFPVEYYGYLVLLGVVLAFFGLAYQKVTFALPTLYKTFVPKVPPYYYGIVAGLLIIPLGLWNPHVLGGGGELVLELISGNYTLMFLIAIFVIRFVFSMISYGTGLPGGIFLPILSLGAILGAIFGYVMIRVIGMPSEYLSICVFFAMAGYFAAIGKAPLTALLLVSEMVGGLSQLMPLGVVVLSAYLTAEFLHMPPIYEALAERLSHSEDSKKVGRRTTFEIPIFADSHVIGKQIKDIYWPEDVLIATIRRGEKEVITKGDVVLQPGDILIVVTDEGIVGRMHTKMTAIVS